MIPQLMQGNYLGHFLLARHLALRRIDRAESPAALHKAPRIAEHLRVCLPQLLRTCGGQNQG